MTAPGGGWSPDAAHGASGRGGRRLGPLIGPARPSSSGGRIAALTTREQEVLGLMAQGYANGAIAQRLFISGKTLESHIGTIFAKLGCSASDDMHRRVVAVLAWLEMSAGSDEREGVVGLGVLAGAAS